MSDIEDIKVTQAYLLSEQPRLYSAFRTNTPAGLTANDTLPPIAVRKQYYNENKDLVSKLTPETLKKFSELPDACLTKLTPMIKMYKVFVVDGKEYAFELIQGRIPSNFYDQARSPQDLDNALVEYPVIQEAEFTRLGGNPAEIDTNIKFSVKLFAKDISSFMTRTVMDSYDMEQAIVERIQHYEDEILDNNTNDLLSGQHLETIETLKTELGSLQAGVGWIDIIKINPGGSLEEGTELITSEIDCRIKVEVGYIDPGDTPPPSLGQEEWNLWRDVIKSQKETFSLSLLKHQFDFRGYEGVDLTVDFIATGNAKQLTPAADIFSNIETEKFIEVRRAQLRNLRSEANSIRYAELYDNEATGIYRDMPEYRAVRQRAHEQAISDCLEDLDERIEYESHQILEAKARLRAQLLNQLYLSNRDSSINREEQSRVYRRIFRYSPQVTEGEPLKYHHDIRYTSLETFLLATGDVASTDGQAQATLLSYNDLAVAGAGEEGHGNEFVLSRLDKADGYHQDTFIFFGDIIEAALEILAVSEEATISITSGGSSYRQGTGHNTGAGRVLNYISLGLSGLVTGGISKVDQFLAGKQKFKSTFTWNPESELQSGVAPNKESAEDIIKLFGGFALGNISYKDPLDPNRINKATIADIPIALDIFRSWWIKNYVSSPKASLSIRDFITALAGFLETEVFRNIPYEYGDGEVPHDTPKFIVNNFKVPPSVKEKIYPTDWAQVKHQDFRIEEVANIENLPGKGFSITTITQVDNNTELQEDTMRLVFGETNKGILKRISLREKIFQDLQKRDCFRTEILWVPISLLGRNTMRLSKYWEQSCFYLDLFFF